MTDYILTVAVSVASGVAAITSAIPSVRPYTVVIGVVVIAVLLAGNRRAPSGFDVRRADLRLHRRDLRAGHRRARRSFA